MKQVASCLAYSSTLTMEGTCFSEKYVDIQRNTGLYIPEFITLPNQRCKNLKAYTDNFFIFS
jgi:hypothetical protein